MRSGDGEYRQNVLNFIYAEIEYDDKFRRVSYPHRAISYPRLQSRFASRRKDEERLDKTLLALTRTGELFVERHPYRADIADAEVVAHYRIPSVLERLAWAAR